MTWPRARGRHLQQRAQEGGKRVEWDPPSPGAEPPADIKAKVETVKAGLKDGSFAIWKGPIVGQDGKEILAKDVVADDKFLGGVPGVAPAHITILGGGVVGGEVDGARLDPPRGQGQGIRGDP